VRRVIDDDIRSDHKSEDDQRGPPDGGGCD